MNILVPHITHVSISINPGPHTLDQDQHISFYIEEYTKQYVTTNIVASAHRIYFIYYSLT